MSKIVVVLSTMLGDLRGATCAGRLVLTPLFGASVFWRSRPFGWAVRLGRSVGPFGWAVSISVAWLWRVDYSARWARLTG